MGVYSNTTANAYADQIKVVYEYLDEIRKVGGRLTPVEDLTSFQAQIAELHGYLDLLVEASNIIVTATPTGEAILTGSVPSIRTLLGIDNLSGNWVTPEDMQAALDALRDLLLGMMGGMNNNISTINVQLTELEQYAVYQQSEINGLQISYSNVAAGLETNQTNTEQALSRLTIREQHATLQDLRLDTIDQSLVSTVLGIQATNDIVAGHTATITTHDNYINLHTTSIDSLSSTLTILEGDVTANATAIDLMETNITAIGDDITAESNRITELRSVIGGSGNLLPNADFASNANGWDITVAEEDWATTVLTVDLFNMPVEVHCLEVLGTPTPLGQIVVESSPVLIQGGKHHIVSGYPCVDNGTITLSYKTFNAAGAVLDQGVCPPTFNATTSTNINDYTRTFVKFLAAETAVKMRLYMTVTGDGDFVTQGALFRPMVEQSWEGQVEPSAWTPNMEGVPQALAVATEELTTRVTSIEGVNTAQATQITTLEARATTIEGVNTSQATAISGLGTRVTAAEGVNTSQASSITSLDSRVTAAEGVNTTQGTAINSLTTRITTAEGDIDTLSSDLTSLTATVGTKASTAALNALTTRVTTAEGNITANSNQITTLNATLSDVGGGNLLKNGGFEFNSTGTGMSDNWAASGSAGSSVYSYTNPTDDVPPNSTICQRISADAAVPGDFVGGVQIVPNIIVGKAYSLSGMMRTSYPSGTGSVVIIQWRDATNTAIGTTAYSPEIAGVNTWLRPKVEGVIAPAGAVTAACYFRAYARNSSSNAMLVVRADNMMFVEGNVALGFEENVAGSEAFNKATATALTSLDARVTSAEGTITAQSSQLTSLTATLSNTTQGLSIAAGQTDAANDWIAAAGAGERSTIASADTTIMGGRLLAIGNNAGNDELWIRHKDTIAYDPNKLYRVRIRGRLSAAHPGGWYAGLFAMNRDKTQYVNTAGTESGGLGASHYVVANATNASFVETVAYFKGFSVGARTGAGTLASPWTMPNNVKHVGFMVIGNYTAQTGYTYIDKLIIEDADALEANATTASAVTLLDARVTSVEGVNTSQATSITTLNSTVAGKADVSAVTALTTRVTDVEQGGYGTNLIPNSTMSTGIAGYGYSQSSSPAWSAPTLNLAGASWHPTRINALGVNNASGGLAAGQYINVNTMNAEIGRSGEAFIGSVYVACHRCQCTVYIAWVNSAGGVISYTGGTTYNAGGGTNGGTDLTNWVRLVATGTAPAGTQSAKVLVQFQGNGNGTPYGWIIRPMLERKRATQTLPSEWNAGGVESFASWNVTLDVNNYITGVQFANDGTTGTFAIRADMFSIVSPGGGARTEYSSGNWRVYDSGGTLRVRMGIW